MTENHNVGEIHGCIVCGRTFNVLAVYSPTGRLVDCAVTSPGGQILPEPLQPLVACNSHPAAVVDEAFKKWQAVESSKIMAEQEDQ